MAAPLGFTEWGELPLNPRSNEKQPGAGWTRCPAAWVFVFFPSFLFFFLASAIVRANQQDEGDAFAAARREMVERDLRGQGIKDEKVLQPMGRVPRHLFVDEAHRAMAYGNTPLAIGEGQTISQPYVVALMTELLDLKGKERVLEIGTGSGYQAAILSLLAREVYTIEIIPILAERAKKTLAALGYGNVTVKLGDGFIGWKERAPFDAIVVTASAAKIPESLWNQLAENGRLVIPIGRQHQTQRLVRATKRDGKRHLEDVTGVLFVPMKGAGESKGR
jgi:protein-L-isoaspartate(D-aspartate) O-methyltransferase